MKKTLYLLRRPVELIDPAIFLPSESRGDIVLLEGSAGGMHGYAGGEVFSLSDQQGDHHLTVDDLVRKIFECDHTVVI